jgi:hypothetical protein
VWSGTAASWIDLHPVGFGNSDALATDGTRQVGYVTLNDATRASLWSGSAESRVDLHPAGATRSAAYGMGGGQQAGSAFVGGAWHASLWSGTAASWVNLDPTGTTDSFACATNGIQQAGYARVWVADHAILWSGSAESRVDLHPAGATHSAAYGIGGTQQVGYVIVNGLQRASLWNGTAASFVDLTPEAAGASESRAWATDGAFQVGWVSASGSASVAALWSGTAASWVNLASFLPPHFESSEAHAVWSDGSNLYVAGSGYNRPLRRTEALLWTRPLPCNAPEVSAHPSAFTACQAGPAAFTVTATGTSPQFQWRKNETDIEGATAAIYTIASVELSDSGSYDCVITNACGTVTSNPATLTVRTPQILTQPSSQTVNVDQPVFFALEADPQHPCFSSLAYHWQRRNPLVEDDAAPNAWLDLNDGGGFAGTHSPSLAIFRPTPGLATGYRCKITNACGCEADANGVVYTNTVNFSAACPSDFNNDGSVDGDDVIEFFERWDSGC